MAHADGESVLPEVGGSAAVASRTPRKEAGSEDPLHVKYRPRDLDEVIGQDKIVKSIRALLSKKDRPHVYLFAGPPGTGKTTLARIIAKHVGAVGMDLIEIDGATYSGVDHMRAETARLHYVPMGGGDATAVIVDEAHAISKQTWQSMLKQLEEPLPHVYWMLCTTDPSKVPEAIRTRCTEYRLKEVDSDDIRDLLDAVSQVEGIKLSDDILGYIAKEAKGSPRRALVYLSTCREAGSRSEAAELLADLTDDGETALNKICTDLLRGESSWDRIREFLQQCRKKGTDAESVRIQTIHYFAAVAINNSNPRRAINLLQCFAVPYNRSDGLAPLVLSFAEAVSDR